MACKAQTALLDAVIFFEMEPPATLWIPTTLHIPVEVLVVVTALPKMAGNSDSSLYCRVDALIDYKYVAINSSVHAFTRYY